MLSSGCKLNREGDRENKREHGPHKMDVRVNDMNEFYRWMDDGYWNLKSVVNTDENLVGSAKMKSDVSYLAF